MKDDVRTTIAKYEKESTEATQFHIKISKLYNLYKNKKLKKNYKKLYTYYSHIQNTAIIRCTTHNVVLTGCYLSRNFINILYY